MSAIIVSKGYTAFEKKTVWMHRWIWLRALCSLLCLHEATSFFSNLMRSGPQWLDAKRVNRWSLPSTPFKTHKHYNSFRTRKDYQGARCDWHKAEGEIWSKDKWGVLNRPCFHQSAKVNHMCHLPEVCSVLLSGTALLSRTSITANTLTQEQMYTQTHTLFLHQRQCWIIFISL